MAVLTPNSPPKPASGPEVTVGIEATVGLEATVGIEATVGLEAVVGLPTSPFSSDIRWWERLLPVLIVAVVSRRVCVFFASSVSLVLNITMASRRACDLSASFVPLDITSLRRFSSF